MTGSNVAVLPLPMMAAIHNVRRQQECGHRRQKFPRRKRICQVVCSDGSPQNLHPTISPLVFSLHGWWPRSQIPRKGFPCPTLCQCVIQGIFGGMLPQSVGETCLEQKPIFPARGCTRKCLMHSVWRPAILILDSNRIMENK